MGVRKEQAERTRQAIVDATRELIARMGYENVKVSDIAKACGIGTGTLYHHFKGKDQIFTYIERGRFDELAREVMDLPGGDIVSSLRAYVLGWFARVEEDDLNVSKCWHVMAVEHKLPGANGRTHLDDDLDNLSELLHRAVDAGELCVDTPVETLARDLAYSLYGASLARCISYEPVSMNDWAQAWCRNMLEPRLAPFSATAPSPRPVDGGDFRENGDGPRC